MPAAEPGRLVSLTLDGKQPILVGDELESRSGRRYQVEAVRVQERGKHIGRRHLRARVLAPDHPRDPDVNVIRFWWYSRNRK